MWKKRWNKIICFNELNEAVTYVLWGTRREARGYVKELRKRGKCTDAYIVRKGA